VQRTYPYHGLCPVGAFADAIAATNPDIIVPADDLATRHLHSLYYREQQSGKAGSQLSTLIERSIGAPESFSVVDARATFIKLAREEGIRVPKTAVIANANDLKEWIDKIGFPIVLKANGSSGGDGVRIVDTFERAEEALRALQAPPILARATKRALLNHDRTLVWPSLLRRRSVVNAQAVVGGYEATSTVACWQGTVLAGLHFEVLNKAASTGHATVVRLVENIEMSRAVEKMVRRLKLSGFHGFDFMLDPTYRSAHLIEMNPRATQVGHLALGPGRDLPSALYAALSGQPVQAAQKVTESETIALFPQEWVRDPASAFLRSGYHDVPWEQPELIHACVRRLQKQNAWHSPHAWFQILRRFASVGSNSHADKSLSTNWGQKSSKSRYE
jgi:hypothetical protein